MRPTTVTKLALADFARILGIHPLHIAQVDFTPAGRSPTICSGTFFQYPWQNVDAVARDEIEQKIAEAEELIERYVGFRLAPTWEVDEWHKSEQPWRPDLVRIGRWDVRNFPQMVRADWGWFVTGGIRATAMIEDGAAITYSDADLDGYPETATVTVTVADGQDPCEVHVYYPGHGGEDDWEIRPINVAISGVTATVTFRRELAVLPALLEALFPATLDGTDDANFLTEVDVWRVYNDPSTQATLTWEPTGGCSCGQSGCPQCAYTVQTACTYSRDNPKHSLVVYTPADWNPTTRQFDFACQTMPRQPDIVRLYYKAGLRDKRKRCPDDMDEEWKRIVTYFAASMLDRPPCDCAATEWEYWREDMSLVRGSDDSGSQKGIYSLPADLVSNPLGARRGAINAWNRVVDDGRGQYVNA